MGLLRKISSISKQLVRLSGKHSRLDQSHGQRKCRFETMESRRMLNADPVFLGATYYESDSGNDSGADVFEVTFEGGSADTQLSEISIEANSIVYFDTQLGGDGPAPSFDFQFDATNSIGLNATDIQSVNVVDGGHSLNIAVDNFEAGDKLVFTIDVDHDLGFSDDPIASGAEFELSTLAGTFTDRNFFVDPVQVTPDLTDPNVAANLQGTEDGVFWNRYDANVQSTPLVNKMSADNFNNAQGNGQADRTAGAVINLELTPRPIEISGTVFHDHDLNLVQDAGDEGIAGTVLTLQYKENAGGTYDDVLDSNGQTATAVTDSNGDYSFGINDGLLLAPGFYRVVETQPADFEVSVGAIPGAVSPINSPGPAAPSGLVDASDPTNVISEIFIPFGDHQAVNFDFAEAKPITISGTVFHDRNMDLIRDASDEGIENVELALFYQSPSSGSFIPVLGASSQPVTTLTDGSGQYNFGINDGLALVPGNYRVVETQPGDFPISVGAIPGVVATSTGVVATGQVDPTDPTNIISEISISESDQHAVAYDFAEAKPITISGTVFHDRNMDLIRDIGDEGIGNVELALYYQSPTSGSFTAVLDAGNQSVTTLTDGSGQYSFGINDGLALAPGMYRVVEMQPGDFPISVGAIPGVVATSTGILPTGQVDPTDPTNIISEISISESDQHALAYDFAEAKPIEISGNVHLSDPNGDCFGPGHPNHRPVEGAQVYLISDGGTVLSTETDTSGNYSFSGTNLLPGTYTIIEVTPVGLFDGSETVGNVNGVDNGNVDQLTEIQLAGGGVMLVSDVVATGEIGRLDFITNIDLQSGDQAQEYHFCEHEGASISGHVFVDADGNGVRDSGEGAVQQPTDYTSPQIVEMVLLDGVGNEVARTTTDALGFYQFDNLGPGMYTVRQGTVVGYFDGQEVVGTINGSAVGAAIRTPDALGVLRDNNEITAINLGAGQLAVDYDFGELVPSSLSGFVYHDANDNGVFDPDEAPLSGVQVELNLNFPNPTNGEVALTADHVLDPSVLDSHGHYVVTTDSDGSYVFEGIRGGVIELEGGGILPGNYAVYQLDQPTGFEDGLDTPGSTGGQPDNFSLNGQQIPQAFAGLLAVHTNGGAREGDLLIAVPVGVGQASANNNFGEVLVELPPPPVDPPISNPPPPVTPPPPINPPGSIISPPPIPQSLLPPGSPFISADVVVPLQSAESLAGAAPFSWHLSVINGGNPRGENVASADGTIWRSASFLDRTDWSPANLRGGHWTLRVDGDEYSGQQKLREITFGTHDGTPIVGDFNGDGTDEVGVFYQGEWFLDLNGNGHWDDQDLWAKLGDVQDRPVVGDWDGDGKDDIGIYGPTWEGDELAIEREPGLPDPENYAAFTPKNVPPNRHEATSGERLIRLTAQGNTRSDVIDHVFRYGVSDDVPIAGDWNGDGVSGIGVYRDGMWSLDVDGDGRISSADIIAEYGRTGDRPVVGDFDGDGVHEIGIYRDGVWTIDSNNNRELDAHDKVFELGGADDTPVVGDWNGDGIDEPGIYRNMARATATARR